MPYKEKKCSCDDHAHIPNLKDGPFAPCGVPVTDYTQCGCKYRPSVYGYNDRAKAYHCRDRV